jgi:3-phosphoshikimate 1-carboxyvinyltransferase
VIIRPAKSIQGDIGLPGDKSISHRAAILSALADGETRIENFSTGEDCASTLRCLGQIGVGTKHKGTSVTIRGVGKTGFRAPSAPLDCGNSGTTMRLLAGVLAGQDFESVLTGDESLRCRPMKRIIEPLKLMGAKIEAEKGLPPLRISPSRLKGIDYKVPVASAQVKSCVLLAGTLAEGETTVREAIKTRDHTERMLRAFGVDIREKEGAAGRELTMPPGSTISAQDIQIPGDISAAAFFLVAAACLPDSNTVLENLGVNPTRTAILDLLMSLGVKIERSKERESLGEPLATVEVSRANTSDSIDSISISGRQTADLIDEIPILAVYGTQLDAGLEVRDARELRIKETDRITAIVTNLRKMKADVEEFDDGFRVKRSALRGARLDSFGDHRIAMAFSIAGLLADGETYIGNAGCVDISFPGFFEALESVVKR